MLFKLKKKRIKTETYEITCNITEKIVKWFLKINEIYFSTKENKEKLEKGQTRLTAYNFHKNKKAKDENN